MENKNYHVGFSIFLLTVVLAVTVFGYYQVGERRNLEAMLANQYYKDFLDMVEGVDNVRMNLGKCLASGSTELRVATLSDVWREAGNSASDLNSLPLPGNLLMTTSNFLNQAGNYSYIMAKKLGSGSTLTSEEWNQLSELKNNAEKLAKEFEDMQADLMTNDFSWNKLMKTAKANTDDIDSKNVLSASFKKVDDGIQSVPTLIYDGPFSDHIQNKTPKELTGAPIDQEEAKKIALSVVPFDANGYVAELIEEIKGKIPGYRISIVPEKDSKKKVDQSKPTASVDISKAGGNLILMQVDRSYDDEKISEREAVAKAQSFLQKQGYSSMIDTFYDKASGFVTIPFVYTIEGCLVYPDMIKIKVALDNGEIVSYDATGYLMSHYTRKDVSATVTSEEAKKSLSTSLQLKTEPKLAIIPTDGVIIDEVLSWEFECANGKDEYYVYVNAKTGKEERILQIINTEEGKLTV